MFPLTTSSKFEFLWGVFFSLSSVQIHPNSGSATWRHASALDPDPAYTQSQTHTATLSFKPVVLIFLHHVSPSPWLTLEMHTHKHTHLHTVSLQTTMFQCASLSPLSCGECVCVCFTSLSLALLKCLALCKVIRIILK